MSNYLYENLEHKLIIEKTSENLYVDERELILEGLHDIFRAFERTLTPVEVEIEIGFINEEYSFRLYDEFPNFQHFMILANKVENTLIISESWSDSEILKTEKIDFDFLSYMIDYALNKNMVVDKEYIPTITQVIFKASYVKVPITSNDLENGRIPVIDDLGDKVGYPAKVIDGDVWAIGPNSISFMPPVYLTLSHESGYFELKIQLPLAIGDTRGESLIQAPLKSLFSNGWEYLK